MGFVLQDRILQPFLQIFSPLSGGRIDTFGAGGGQNSPIRGQSGLFPKAGRGTNQKGAQEGPEGELKQEEPEQVMAGTEGRRNRKKATPEGSEQGRQCGRRKGHAGRGRGGRERRRGGVGAGKAMWPGKGVERPGPEKGRCRGWRKSYAGGKGQRNAVSIQQAERNLRQGSSAPQGDAGSAI